MAAGGSRARFQKVVFCCVHRGPATKHEVVAIRSCDILSAIDSVPEFARKKFGRCPISAAERDFAYGSALLPSFISSLHVYVLTPPPHVYVFDVDGG